MKGANYISPNFLLNFRSQHLSHIIIDFLLTNSYNFDGTNLRFN